MACIRIIYPGGKRRILKYKKKPQVVPSRKPQKVNMNMKTQVYSLYVHLEDTIIKSVMQLLFLLVIFPCYVTAK